MEQQFHKVQGRLKWGQDRPTVQLSVLDGPDRQTHHEREIDPCEYLCVCDTRTQTEQNERFNGGGKDVRGA